MTKHHHGSRSELLQKRSVFRRSQLVAVALVLAVGGAYWVSRSHAASGSLTLTPSASTVGAGATFTVTIRENSGSDAINAVQADLTYPSDKLQFVSIDSTGSAFGLQAAGSGSNGVINIARAVNGGSPAVTGDQLVATLTFKALTTGSAAVDFADSSLLIRASDQTNILITSNTATFTLSDLVAPSVPSGITAPTRTLNTIGLTWTASTDNIGVTGYKVFRNGTQVGTPTAASFTDTGLAPGANYSYTVAAVDAAGNSSAQSTSATISTLPDTTAPSVPAAPTSATQTMNSVALSWAASTDNVGVTGYRVYRGGVLINTVTATNYSDTGLTSNTTYTYTISAIDAAGNASAQSPASNIKTLADTQAPTVPAGLSASVNDKSVTLAWSASTDNVGVTGYVIYRNNVQIATPTSLTYVDSNLADGNYSYTVAAKDATGNISAKSTTATAQVFKPADLNRDGKINIFDLSSLLSNWGKTGSNTGDVNGDGVVNIFDLSALLSAWTG